MKPLVFGWCAVATAFAESLACAGAAEVAIDVRQQITALRAEIAQHDAAYHRDAAPDIADYDYDLLKQRLASLEQQFPSAAKAAPPLAEIGDDRSGAFQTYRHRERMLSLDKTYSEAELRGFHARMSKAFGRDDLAYVVEPKFDGIAVSATYEKGKLVRAVTRGNGIEGDDITANARRISNFPERLRGEGLAVPDLIEIRGEIYVPFAELERVNAERDAAGLTLFANARNLAAGTIRQVDAEEVRRRGLQVVFYGVGACEPLTTLPATQHELHGTFRAWGLPAVAEVWPARGIENVVQAISRVNEARRGFAFPTDGAVVKLDALAGQREAGIGEHAPRWAVAFKFAPERIETQVRAITIQVGRTGVLTPVAELIPVQLSGSTIARATLHNRDEIARKDIRVGDTIYLEKAGEIIPAIVGVNREKRSADAKPFEFPMTCPVCRAPVAQRKGEVALRCSNAACPAQLRRRLEHFASTACVDIEGLGPTLVEALVSNGGVKELPDVYRLRRDDLLMLPRTSEKTVDRLLAAIERSKHAELWRFVYGIGVPGVGVAAAKDLARRFRTLEALAANREVDAPAANFAEPRVRAMIAAFTHAGVDPVAPATVSEGAAGKLFVLTGTLPTLTRAQATGRIETAGGKVSGSVTRNTSFVVAGAEPGAKLEQARKLGVPVIDETALLRLLAGDETPARESRE